MKKFLVLAMSLMAMIVLGCGGTSNKATSPAKEVKTVQLAAAASLEKVFEQQLIPMFNKKHPEIKIQGIYDASGKLQSQIENGLNADLFISAANKQMQALDKKGYMDSASIKPLLENKLVLIVPAKGESTIKEFKDLAKAKHPAIGDPASVPAGQYAKEALTSLAFGKQLSSKPARATKLPRYCHGWVVVTLIPAWFFATTPR